MSNAVLRRPSLAAWRSWTFDDYLAYFLSVPAMRARLRGETPVVATLSDTDFRDFCAPIRDRLQAMYGGRTPRVSIQIPAYNEQLELLPTLLSYTRLDVGPGEAELIVADNQSTDHTAAILECCGARRVVCVEKGVGRCRKAAYDATAPTAEYVWLTDADTRVVAPMRTAADTGKLSSILQRNLRFLDSNPNVLGLSTGGLVEGAHWAYLLVNRMSRCLGKSKPLSCWSGCNQFIRRWALDEIGGIDVEVEFRDDHHRTFQLARLGKRLRKDVFSANMKPELADPVFYSGRRYATMLLTFRHYMDVWRRKRVLERDEYGYPVHPKQIGWRDVRRG